MVVQGPLGLLRFRPKRLHPVVLGALFLSSLSKERLRETKLRGKKKFPSLDALLAGWKSAAPEGTALSHLVVGELLSEKPTRREGIKKKEGSFSQRGKGDLNH